MWGYEGARYVGARGYEKCPRPWDVSVGPSHNPAAAPQTSPAAPLRSSSPLDLLITLNS